MVFDLRGRRRNVVKVAYAILAVLMGASLFLVMGPGSIGELFGGNGASTSEAAKQYEQRATKLEQQLRKQPGDPDLLLALTRQRIYAGNALAVQNPQTGEVQPTAESHLQFQRAANSWDQYLRATDEPNPTGAQLIAPTLFSLAETSTTPGEIEANLKAAAEAQQIIADARPSLGSLSTLAIFKYFTFDYDGAAADGKKARRFATNKFERESLENRLEETEKSARQFEKRFNAYVKASKGQGKESLQSPFGPLGGSTASP